MTQSCYLENSEDIVIQNHYTKLIMQICDIRVYYKDAKLSQSS